MDRTKAAVKIRDTDVLFMHADDEATLRYRYAEPDLREGLLLHMLYFGRVLVPLPFLLDNPRFGGLFRVRGDISEHSDAYRLVRTGHLVPVLINSDAASSYEYARQALDRGILIHCGAQEFLRRAELLDQGRQTTAASQSPMALKAAFVELLHNDGVLDYYGLHTTMAM